jgi:hypothetical protein
MIIVVHTLYPLPKIKIQDIDYGSRGEIKEFEKQNNNMEKNLWWKKFVVEEV